MPGNDVIHPICDRWGRQRNWDFCSVAEPARTWPYMLWISPAEQRLRVRNASDDDWIAIGGGNGGGGAPANASYLVLAFNADLSAERRLVTGDGLQATDAGPNGNYTLSVKVSDFAGAGLGHDGSNNLRIATTAAGDGLQGGGGSALAVKVSDIAGTGLQDDGLNNLRIATTAAGDGLTGGGGSALAVDSTVVRTSGNQTISGIKTFIGTVDLDGQAKLILDGSGDTSISSLSENKIAFEVGGTDQMYLEDSWFYPATDNYMTLGKTDLCWAVVYAKVIDMRGYADALVLNPADGGTTISAPISGQIDFEVAGVDKLHLVSTKLYPTTDDDIDLGDGTHEFRNAYFDGTVYVDAISMVNTVNEFSTDGTLGGNSNSAVPTEKAVKTYVDGHTVSVDAHARAYRASGTLNVADSTWVTLTYTGEDYDTGNDMAIATGIFTAPVNGYYLVAGHMQFDSAAWGDGKTAILSLYKGASIESELNRIIVAAVTSEIGTGGVTVVYLTAGQTIHLEVYQNSGSTKTIKAARHNTWFAVSQLIA